MKNKLFLSVILFLVFLSGCKSIEYLPDVGAIDVNTHGSYISVYRNKNKKINGELIAVNKNAIFIKGEKEKKIISISINDIKRFKLKYAKGKNYYWAIPVFAVASLSHGFLLIVSLPINLIATAIVAGSGTSDFKYKSKGMSLKKLKMFARFPQGLPPNIELFEIR